jgi:ring-1,2-phenylacetyl-CoA epoxidase subunit PaaE
MTVGAFHPLRVAEVARLTDDAVTIELAVPSALADTYRFASGQHLTLRTRIEGREVRRSYSICVPPASGRLRVAVKALPGGAFSQLANHRLAAGDVLDVLPPVGRFGLRSDAQPKTQPNIEPGRRYAAVVAGSGITPIMSIMPAVLADRPDSSFALVYGNRGSGSVMFLEEIADLKDRYPGRLQVLHVLSRERQDAELLSGRIDAARLDLLLTSVLPVHTVDQWLLCGPFGMVEQARAALAGRGVPASDVHRELFHVAGEAPRPARSRSGPTDPGCRVTVRLDGRETTFAMPDEGSVLDAVLAHRPDAPYACKGGVCGTCRVRVVEGTVRMGRNFALEPDEVAAGFALACQAVPTSERLVVDLDA